MKDRDRHLIWESYSSNFLTELNLREPAPAFILNADQVEEYFDEVTDGISPRDTVLGLEHERLTRLVKTGGERLFSVQYTGIDPEVDGIEHYYKVTNEKIADKIADLVDVEPFNIGGSEGVVNHIREGVYNTFIIFIHHSEGEQTFFSGDEIFLIVDPETANIARNWLEESEVQKSPEMKFAKQIDR